MSGWWEITVVLQQDYFEPDDFYFGGGCYYVLCTSSIPGPHPLDASSTSSECDSQKYLHTLPNTPPDTAEMPPERSRCTGL